MNDHATKVGETLYALGYIRCWLESYSSSSTLSADELATGVATLLLGQTGRQGMGLDNRLSSLRSNSAKRSKILESLEMARRPHGKTPKRVMSARGRAAISRAQKKRWRKVKGGQAAYWARMTPEQRSAEMKRRLQKRVA